MNRLPLSPPAFCFFLALFLAEVHGQANSSENPADLPDEKTSSSKIIRGTSLFDAQQVRELFEKTKRENAERARNTPVHLNPEELKLYHLSPVRVKGDNSEEVTKRLKERLDKDYREKRLNAIKRLDPKAYYDIKVTQRNEDAFFRGENDLGRPREVPPMESIDNQQIGEAFEKTAAFLKKVFGGGGSKKDN